MPKLPSAKEMRNPLLALLKRKGEISLDEALNHIAKHFKLSKAACKARQDCKKETVLQNRLRWARWQLKREGLIETSKRGHFRLKHIHLLCDEFKS